MRPRNVSLAIATVTFAATALAAGNTVSGVHATAVSAAASNLPATSVAALAEPEFTVDPQPLGATVTDIDTRDSPFQEPTLLGEVGGVVYASASDATGGRELFTVTGDRLQLLADINPYGSSSPSDVMELNGTPYVRATDGSNIRRLYAITDDGDVTVVPGIPGTIREAVQGPDFIVIVTYTDTERNTMYTFDGSTVEEVNLGGGDNVEVYGSAIGGGGLIADVLSGSRRLWKINHGAATELLYNGDTIDGVMQLMSDGTTVYFGHARVDTGTELYRTDGTTVTALETFISGADGLSSYNFAILGVVDGTLYVRAPMSASARSYEQYFWAFDGVGSVVGPITSPDTSPAAGVPILARSGESAVLGDKVLVAAEFDSNATWNGGDTEPAYIDTTATPPVVRQVSDLAVGASSLNVNWNGIWDETAILSAGQYDPYPDHITTAAYRYDGTTLTPIAGVTRAASYFSGLTLLTGTDLWFQPAYLGSDAFTRYDGDTVSATPLPNTGWGSLYDSNAQYVTAADGTRYGLVSTPEPGLYRFDLGGAERIVALDGTGYRGVSLFAHGTGVLYLGKVNEGAVDGGFDLRYWDGDSDTVLIDTPSGDRAEVASLVGIDGVTYAIVDDDSDMRLVRIDGASLTDLAASQTLGGSSGQMAVFDGVIYVCVEVDANTDYDLYRYSPSNDSFELVGDFQGGCTSVTATTERLYAITDSDELMSFDGTTLVDITPDGARVLSFSDTDDELTVVKYRIGTDDYAAAVAGDQVTDVEVVEGYNYAYAISGQVLVRSRPHVDGLIMDRITIWNGDTTTQYDLKLSSTGDIAVNTQDGVRRVVLEWDDSLVTWHPDEGFTRHSPFTGEPVLGINDTTDDFDRSRRLGIESGTFAAYSIAGYEPLWLGRVPSSVGYTASGVSAAGVMSVSWVAPGSAGDDPIDGYRVQVVSADGSEVGVRGSCRTAATERSCEITGLDPSADYTVEVSARNRFGYSVPSADATSFVSLTPARILDTRGSDPVGELDGSGDAFVLQVTGVGGVPSSGVSAVALNVTVVDGQANDFGGFVTVFPCGTRPDASNLNFVSGQTVPNSVIAPLSSSGTVCLYVYGVADLLVDVSGYFVSGFEPLTPDRILDTRGGDPVGELDGSGDAYTLQVTGGDVPSSATAVALNVTVVDGEANDFGGFVTVFPCGTRPDASNLNFVSGQTVPNSVIAPLSSSGTVCLYVYGQADLLVDVSGYFTSGFTPQVPDRILDTRGGDPVGELDGTGDAYTLQVTGSTVPASATAVALNVTVVDGEANDFGGFVTVFPCGTRPDASNLNFVSGQTVPNSVIAPLSASGTVCLYVYGQADLLVDVSGYL